MTATDAGQNTCSTLPLGHKTHRRTLYHSTGRKRTLRPFVLGVVPFSVRGESLSSQAERKEDLEVASIKRMGRQILDHPGALSSA